MKKKYNYRRVTLYLNDAEFFNLEAMQQTYAPKGKNKLSQTQAFRFLMARELTHKKPDESTVDLITKLAQLNGEQLKAVDKVVDALLATG